MALDIQVQAGEGGAARIEVLKATSWEYRMTPVGNKQNALKNIPFISAALGGEMLPTWNVDFGDKYEQIIVQGIISEGSAALNFDRFEELRRFFHKDCWEHHSWLKIGTLTYAGGVYHSEVYGSKSVLGYEGLAASWRTIEESGHTHISWILTWLFGVEFFKND